MEGGQREYSKNIQFPTNFKYYISPKCPSLYLTPWLTNPCQLLLHSSEGSSFFCFCQKKKNKEHLVKYCSNINRLERDVKAIEVCSPQPQWLTMNGDDGQQTNWLTMQCYRNYITTLNTHDFHKKSQNQGFSCTL